MAEDCIFCRIAEGEIPSEIVYEDKDIVAFKDVSPQAPIHIVIIPRKHYTSILAIPAGDAIMGKIQTVISRLAIKFGVAEDGFRVVNNCGEAGGQTVPHVHFHFLAGRNMAWPPG
jgi:histidine triad (HIT) family protein